MRPFDPRLVRLVPASRGPVLALAGIGVLQGTATIGVAFALTRLVVDVVTAAPVLAAALWLGGLFAARAALSFAGERVSAWAGVAVSTGLREQLVRAWSARTADTRPEPARALTLATQGTTSVEPYVARYLPTLVAGAVLPVLAIATLAVVDAWSAVIVVLTVPLLPLFAALIGRTTAESTARRWRALAALSGHFMDVMRGLPTLVSFGRAEAQVTTIGRVSARHRRATVRTLRLAFLSSAALELLATISVAMVAVTVGIRLAGGSMPLSTAMLAILLAPEAYWPIRRVGAEFHAAADGAQALEEVLAELTAGPQPVVPQPVATPSSAPASSASSAPVRVTGLAYRHPGAERDVLTDLSLQLPVGLTVVTGVSGAGKSTLLELLAGLRQPSAGTVTGPAAHLVTQRPFLAPATVRENLTLGCARTPEDPRLWQALREVGLDGVVAALPEGLATRLGDDGFGLSAGQRARLAIARATLSEAPLILLDEPTAHLDAASAALAHQVLMDLARRRPVVAVTHRRELVSLADQHLHLHLSAGRTAAHTSTTPTATPTASPSTIGRTGAAA